MPTFSQHILSYHLQLSIPPNLPKGVSVMHPFLDESVHNLSAQFYGKYYADNKQRILILGINPGRFGAGVTGVPFTDPARLEQITGIKNTLIKRPELSAEFMYSMIAGYGGAKKFYQHFYINSVYPLGLLQYGKNRNYYDSPLLRKSLQPYIIDHLRAQKQFPITDKVVICLGEGANFKFLQQLNNEYHFFENIFPLPHPRYILQYKRKQLEDYKKRYVEVLKQSKAMADSK